MCEVIGFEGNLPKENEAVSWGAAAISVKEHLINSVTGLATTKNDTSYLVDQGYLTLLPKAIAINKKYILYPLHVVVINVKSLFYFVLKADIEKLEGVVETLQIENFQILIFNGRNTFNTYCDKKISSIVNLLLYNRIDSEHNDVLINIGLTLNSTNPYINAVKVYFSNNDKFCEELSRASLYGKEQEKVFGDFLKFLNNEYEKKYE